MPDYWELRYFPSYYDDFQYGRPCQVCTQTRNRIELINQFGIYSIDNFQDTRYMIIGGRKKPR